MGHFGFSYIGLIFLLLLFLPNLIWTRCRPQGYSAAGESPVLRLLERIGQVLVSASVLIFSDLNVSGWSLRCLWLIGAAGAMALYEYWWVRYFRSERTLPDFCRPLLCIPVPGAALPVAAALALGIYSRLIWLIAAALILGIGHIGIHLQHLRACSRIPAR